MTLRQVRLFVDTLRYLDDVDGLEKLSLEFMASPYIKEPDVVAAEIRAMRRQMDDRFYLPTKLRPK